MEPSPILFRKNSRDWLRISVGATPSGIARLVLGQAAKWTIAGAAIGLLTSIGTTRFLSSLLYRVSPRDPFALIASTVCLVFVALLATANPVRQAATVDPVDALRNDN